jgi:hypothetical protein
VTVTVRLVVLMKNRPVTVKVTWVALTGTVILAGTLAVLVFERVSVNEVPLGAGPLRVIVPVEVSLAPIVVGLNVKLLGAGGCTVSVVVCETPLADAVMVTGVELVTADRLLATANVAVVLPAGTITLDGTPTTPPGLALRATLSPPLGAGLVRVTVPVAFAVLPTTVVGFTATLLGAIVFLTVREGACRCTPR